jgi:hypothetical protein
MSGYKVSTPIIEDGPFTLSGNESWGWDIAGVDGRCIVHITGILIDGSGTGQYENGIIRTREQQKTTAEFVVAAMNKFGGR